LGYYSCQFINGKKENMLLFWGYRTHVIVSKEGICLVEKTLPNNITDAEAAISLLSVAIENQMTIAHLAATGVAVAAGVLLKQPDKIRCYRTFAKAG